MTRYQYYTALKKLACEIRKTHGLATPRVTLTDMRRIYKSYGITIKLWQHKLKSIRGAYFNDETGPHVLIDKNLPAEQRIFTLAHELKHHVAGDDHAKSESNPSTKEPMEIGAEIFAAELIYPEAEFAEELRRNGVSAGSCKAEDIVRLKHDTRTTLSYTSLAKRAEYLGLAPNGSLKAVRWRKLAEEIYGEPDYKRIQRIRAARRQS